MQTQATLTATDYREYFHKAISYENYLKNFRHEMEGSTPSEYAQYLPQNWQRQSRLDRKLKLTDALLEEIGQISQPINWLVITEHWCGDASQINPILNKIATTSNKINLRFIYRDENLELIDTHLTDGRSRSIPILIQLDDQFNVISTYGPRPAEAQKLVKSILKTGESYDVPLHTWYAKDKQQSVQRDLTELIGSLPIL